jgi:translation initiation factor IF-3
MKKERDVSTSTRLLKRWVNANEYKYLKVISGYYQYALFSWYKILEVFVIANKEKDLYINEQIRAKEVMVIGPNGEQLGIKSINDALTLATYAGFDLVMINQNGNPPVCKVMDYNKFKYQNKKRQKDNIKKQREANLELKEYRLSVTIDIHDFNTRVKNSSKYLEKGHRVKASIRFKGREMAHTELGRDVLIKFAEALSNVSDIEQKPTLDGRNMTMILMPKKEK